MFIDFPLTELLIKFIFFHLRFKIPGVIRNGNSKKDRQDIKENDK